MNVFYTCDNNYIWLMGISAISLFENNRHIPDLIVYLLGENINAENKGILCGIAQQYHRKIIVIDIPGLDIPETLVSKRWPLSAFTRLFAATLLPEEMDRALYLDCDTIICGDIGQIGGVDVAENIFWGVKDCVGSAYKENIGLKKQDVYINAGVLLINLKELRKVNVSTLMKQYMKKYGNRINYADQDILNGVFYGQIGLLHPKYDVMTIGAVHSYQEIQILRKPANYYTEEELRAAVLDPVIIHYTTNMRVIRPWYSNTNHPLAAEFRRYFDISPWNEKVLQDMVFSTKEARLIGLIQKLPRRISYRLLGLIHAQLKPYYIRLQAK
ncbi:MAG: glycosyltransferase family 8 protein [Lachnospiraceae bacterium]|nr:glycosyltransferase family 8 protein [Lachnospiraceae bacterium]